MRLSAHFTLQEFLRSETAARRGIDMTPSDQVKHNLSRLANEVLEPIREAAGVPLIITSGYRPPALNIMVGGAQSSDHQYGRAADFHALGMELDELAKVVHAVGQSLPIAKAIVEFNAWMHVSIEPMGRIPSRRFLTASREDGKTIYRDWLA